MNKNDLNFDEDGYIYDFKINSQTEEIDISINIDYISDDEIDSIFKDLILEILENSNIWYDNVIKYVKNKTQSNKVYISTIFIHNFKKNGKYIFGLSFISGLEEYSEHGIGMMLTTIDYEIIDFGDEEIAFIYLD